MNLTPREKDKLLIAMAAMVARRRLERGVKLNHPEAVALISDFVVGRSATSVACSSHPRSSAACSSASRAWMPSSVVTSPFKYALVTPGAKSR